MFSVPNKTGKFLATFPNNLTAQLNTFVGRTRELAETKALISESRLLTVTGAGGVGKTRLALLIGEDLLASFDEGVWLVELAPLNHANYILPAIAAIFDLAATQYRPLLEIVTDHLRAGRCLLLLDNCEHLIEACAWLADHLLRTCPGLRILATSREALGINGEVVYRVPSLALAGPDGPANIENPCEAVQLFVERAKAIMPPFVLNMQNSAAIVQICQQLDGIPLAIELAAACLRAFSPEQIVARLDDRFRLLNRGSRTALPRHQTLRAMIDWSYDLLSEPERALFQQLSIFAGSWTFEAAEAVSLDVDVLEVLPRLVDKSLVSLDEKVETNRYRLLETIRQYGREKLVEAGKADAAQARYFDYFLQVSEEARSGLRGDEFFSWVARLDAESDNLRAITEWGIVERPEDALRLLSNFLFWSGIDNNPLERADLLRKLLDEVETLSAAWRQSSGRARALLAISSLILPLARVDQLPQIFRDLQEAVAISRKDGEPFMLAHSLSALASVQLFSGETGSIVRNTAEESVTQFKAIGEERWTFLPRTILYILFRVRNEHEAAEEQYRELTQLVSRFEHLMQLPSYQELGYHCRWKGDFSAARQYYEQGLQLAHRTKNKTYEAILTSNLAHLARHVGDMDEALAKYRQSIIWWKDLGHRGAVAHELECLGFTAYAKGLPERTVRLLAAAESLRETCGDPMDDAERLEYDEQLTALHHSLDAASFDLNWQIGRAMTMDEAISFGLDSSKTAFPSKEDRVPRAARATGSTLVESLSKREREVLELIAEGLSNAEIAQRLFLATTTVKVHIRHIFEKLGVKSRTAAVAEAKSLKLI